jgi:hypothetical protein
MLEAIVMGAHYELVAVARQSALSHKTRKGPAFAGPFRELRAIARRYILIVVV